MPIGRLILFLSVVALAAAPSNAQTNQFETAIKVNGEGISNYEIDQRIRLLRSFGLDGELRGQAEEVLIEEKLYVQAAERNGIALADGELESGMEEFALRTNLTVQQFLAEIARYGVTRNTYQEFVRAGLLWRTLVNTRFDPLVADLAFENVDRTLGQQVKRKSLEVLLSEIVIPYAPEQRENAMAYARRIETQVETKQDFENIARQVSASPTRQNGGDLDWLPFANLPNQAQRAIGNASNGTVVEPVEIQGVIYVFFKRATRETEVGPQAFETEFATLAISESDGASAEETASEIMSRISTCRELEAESGNWDGESFKRRAIPAGSDSEGYGSILSSLDGDEAAFVAASNSGRGIAEIVMLCDRKIVRNEEQRESVIFGLQNSKIEDYARNYISELTAAAHIQR